MLLALAAGWVVGTVLQWVNQRLVKKSFAAVTITVTLVVAQTVGSIAAGVAITPAGLYNCVVQDKEIDWVGGRCSYVFSGEMIDASYPLLHKDERTIQDGLNVVEIGTYTVKNGGGEGTIKTRDGKITESTVDPSLVGQPLQVVQRGDNQRIAQVANKRSLAGPLGGHSPKEGFCYDGKLYKAQRIEGTIDEETKAQGSCPAGDDSIPHMDNQ